MGQQAVATSSVARGPIRLWPFVMAAMVLCAMPASGDVARGSANAELTLAPAPADSDGDWTYTIKPDDTPAAIADRLLSENRNAGQLMGYNGRARDAALEPGNTLQVPVQWLERRPRPARAIAVRGQAWRTSHPEGTRDLLDEGDRLNVGDGVRTASDGYARIRLADGSTLAIEPDSRLQFNRLTQYGRGAMADTRMNLKQGRIETHVEPTEENGSRFEIHTPSAVAAVRGTRFGLEAREDGTLLEVREGEVWFGTRQDMQPIREGYSAFLSPGPGSEPVIRPLPPTSQLASNADGLESEVPLQARPATLQTPAQDATVKQGQPEFEWSLQGDSEQARVEVARSAAFEETIATSTWETGDSARVNEPLEPGQYCWRVATRAGGESTATSPVNCFRLAGSLDATRVISANTIDDRVNLYWQSVDSADGYRIQIAEDRDFERIVQDREVSEPEIRMRLDPGERYHVRVKGLAPPPMHSDWGEVREIAVE